MSTVTELRSQFFQAYTAAQYSQAVKLAAQVYELDKQDLALLYPWGLSYHHLGQNEKAIELLDQVVAGLDTKDKNNQEAFYNYGIVLLHYGSIDKAYQAFVTSYHLNPEHVDTLQNLALLLGQMGKTPQACALLHKATQLAPSSFSAFTNFGSVLREVGDVVNAFACFDRAFQLNNSCSGILSNKLFMLQHLVDSPQELRKLHSEWAQHFEAPYKSDWPTFTRDITKKRLRLGFVAQDFRVHTVGVYLLSILQELPRDQFDIVLYNAVSPAAQDYYTSYFRAVATQWIDVQGLADYDLAQRIMADQIDILFDISGHTAGSRLTMMCRYHPAPLQMHWLGYTGTLGVEGIDYIISNHHVAFPGVEAYYTEKILRFDHRFAHQCYAPRLQGYPAPSAELPSRKNGYVTFGAMANAAKINRIMLGTWVHILGQAANSRLILQGKGFEDTSHPVREALLSLLSAAQLDQSRVEFRGYMPFPDSVVLYRDVDIALDTYPYSGCTTTCEALSMGCPVITWVGATAASRHTYSFIKAVESYMATVEDASCLTDLIANNQRSYIDAAVSLAQRERRREWLRHKLIHRVSGAIGNPTEMAQNLSRLLWQAWTTQSS